MRLDYRGMGYMSRIVSLLTIRKLITRRSLVATKTSAVKGVGFIINSIFPRSYRSSNTRLMIALYLILTGNFFYTILLFY
jgi:hypothetical protein